MTDIRRSVRYRNITSIADVNTSSTAASNNQTLAYDSTSGYLEPIDVVPLDTASTISGNVTFEGGIRLDADGGTLIREIRAMDVTFPDNSSGYYTQNITFTPAFNSVPIVSATPTATNADARELQVSIDNLTASGCTVAFTIRPAITMTNIVIKLLLFEV